MTTSRAEICAWFEEGLKQKATHMIIVCDTFSYDDYPVFVRTNDNPKEVVDNYNNRSMQRVMEVYNLSLPMTQQLNEDRAFNY